MPPRLLILTGLPRSGTTLCCHLLNQAPNTVALFEPVDVFALPAEDRAAAVEAVLAHAQDARRDLLERGRAISYHAQGQVPDNPAGDIVGSRRSWRVERGEVAFDKPLDAGFTLAIKHNAAFTALLPELAAVAPCLGVVRNPLAVLASWNSLELPVSRGHVPAGERLDPALAAALAAEPELFERQRLVLDWFTGRFLDHLGTQRLVRYETLVRSPGSELFERAGLSVPELAPLGNRNTNAAYPREAIARMAEHLLSRPGRWRELYDEDEVRALATSLCEPGPA
ncbi:hypothetical protein [Arenimonas sp.]|uniref:hypothetical protein n=1 Tax=Arenimonas sp. TaxID=1872635 RepID=UPI0035B06D9D